jgi:hypothetical protein
VTGWLPPAVGIVGSDSGPLGHLRPFPATGCSRASSSHAAVIVATLRAAFGGEQERRSTNSRLARWTPLDGTDRPSSECCFAAAKRASGAWERGRAVVVQSSRLPSRSARARSWLEAAVSRSRVYLPEPPVRGATAQYGPCHAWALTHIGVSFPELRLPRMLCSEYRPSQAQQWGRAGDGSRRLALG